VPKATWLILALFLLGGGTSLSAEDPSPSPLTVAAAANLAAVGPDLAAAFQASRPDTRLDFVYGASGTLVAQIRNGAPYQVFMSADTAFADQLEQAGLTVGRPTVYASGSLILLSAKPRDFSTGLALLADSSVSQFALANPETAPYGRAAKEALTKAGLWESLKPKAVTAQSVALAVQYTLTATGIGFVNKSALYTKELAGSEALRGRLWMEVPAHLYAPIDQSFVVLKAATGYPDALAFASFLGSDAARAIFLRFGYSVPAQ
jgi:molybdate transport system substrate-binding protein